MRTVSIPRPPRPARPHFEPRQLPSTPPHRCRDSRCSLATACGVVVVVASALWIGGAGPGHHFGSLVSAAVDATASFVSDAAGWQAPPSEEVALPRYDEDLDSCLDGPPFAAEDIGVEPTTQQEHDMIAEFQANLRARLLVDGSPRTRSSKHHAHFQHRIIVGDHFADVPQCANPACERFAGSDAGGALSRALEHMREPAVIALERIPGIVGNATILDQVARVLRHPFGRRSLTVIFGLDAALMADVLAAVCAVWPSGNVDAAHGLMRIYPTVRAAVVPPHRIPPTLYDEFTTGGRVPIGYEYFNNAVDAAAAPIVVTWTKEKIAHFAGLAAQRQDNYYNGLDAMVYAAFERNPIRGLSVAVMGSLEPWYEVVALEFGAAEVLTVEYGARVSEDPRIRVVSPAEFAASGRRFDVVLSFSSFEHDGLGRYGDPLDGVADLAVMARVRDRVLAPGGRLFLVVPMGYDGVVFNAHRVYGPVRWPRLVAGWEVLDAEGFEGGGAQNVWVLTPNATAPLSHCFGFLC